MKLSLEELRGLFRDRDEFQAHARARIMEDAETIRGLRRQVALQVAHRERAAKVADSTKRKVRKP